jgi:hypothetical protein
MQNKLQNKLHQLVFVIVIVGYMNSMAYGQRIEPGPGAGGIIINNPNKGKIVVTVNGVDHIIQAKTTKFVPMMSMKCKVEYNGATSEYQIDSGQIIQIELPGTRTEKDKSGETAAPSEKPPENQPRSPPKNEEKPKEDKPKTDPLVLIKPPPAGCARLVVHYPPDIKKLLIDGESKNINETGVSTYNTPVLQEKVSYHYNVTIVYNFNGKEVSHSQRVYIYANGTFIISFK